MRQKYHRGPYGWLGLALVIGVYELTAPPGQLLSEACDQWIDRQPILARTGIWGGAIYLAAHLANTLQDAGLERYDLLARLPKLTHH